MVSVKPREQPERKQIKIELAKTVPLPPSTPPGKNESFAEEKSSGIFVILAQPSAPPPPPPPPPLYDPEADNDSSNTATHLQDRIGEYEDMELDDVDEVEPPSMDEQSSSTTFMEERTAAPSLPPPPPPPATSLYDDDDNDDTPIPTEINPVSSSFLPSFSFFLLFRSKVMTPIQMHPPSRPLQKARSKKHRENDQVHSKQQKILSKSFLFQHLVRHHRVLHQKILNLHLLAHHLHRRRKSFHLAPLFPLYILFFLESKHISLITNHNVVKR